MSGSYHHCEWCSFPVYAGQGVVAWTLGNREVVVHRDRAVCEELIRTDPDAGEPYPPLVSVPWVEPEHRTTGAGDRERGWMR